MVQQQNAFYMEMEAVVPFDEGIAHYLVSPDNSGIYQARLVQFEGNAGRMPPNEVILVKGYRQWSGSYERQDLLNSLGEAIEMRIREGNPAST
jgi:hypothetical protein